MTFEIKVSTRPDKAPLKLKVSEHEDKVQTVAQFCRTYRITAEREEIIKNEVLRFFEARANQSIADMSAYSSRRGAAASQKASPRRVGKSFNMY